MPKQLPRPFLRRHSTLQFFDPDFSAAMAKSLGEQLVVAGDGDTFKDVVLRMPQGRLGAAGMKSISARSRLISVSLPLSSLESRLRC